VHEFPDAPAPNNQVQGYKYIYQHDFLSKKYTPDRKHPIAPNKAIILMLSFAITSKPIAAMNDNKERRKRFIIILVY